jgi:hypothetical protein
MPQELIYEWQAAWMHVSLGRSVSIVTSVNSATNEKCLLVPRTMHNENRAIHHFFYGLTEEQLRPQLGFKKRKLFRIQLCLSDACGQQRHHLNLQPAEVANSGVKLTVHRNPNKLKGKVVRQFSLSATKYFLAETAVQ